MSIDYKIIYERIQNLHQELIYQLGKCYLNDRSYEGVLISFVHHLELALYPNDIFLKDTVPLKEFKYEKTK